MSLFRLIVKLRTNPHLNCRELKTALIEEAKEKSAIDAQRKALIAENNELKTQLSSLKTESSASKLSLQAKINELITKTEAQAKEMSLLEVSDRKGYVYS